MPKNVIDARHFFPMRAVDPLTNDEHLATARRIFADATEKCEAFSVSSDAVVTALAIEILKLADANSWPEDRRQKVLPPALQRLLTKQDDVPY